MPTFEWTESKARANRKKHGVGFSEAALVFADPLARIFPDDDHSSDEHREIIIGHSPANRLSFTESAADVVRIISARTATKREQQDYEENF